MSGVSDCQMRKITNRKWDKSETYLVQFSLTFSRECQNELKLILIDLEFQICQILFQYGPI